MAYTSATFYIDPQSGSDTARTALTSVAVANNGAGVVRCTKAAHGLVTGAVGTATLNYAGMWKVNVIDANNFDLLDSVYSTATALTFTPVGGSSKADAWKTITPTTSMTGNVSDSTFRYMASPDPTLVGNATWTQYSAAITLASAVTANITVCDTVWTASANVTCSASTTRKQGSFSAQQVVAGGFTTGIIAYFATGTLNLSAYQQVSFFIMNSIAVAAGCLSLRLCSDTVGAVVVHTIAIPALAASGSTWTRITVDTGGALNSAIASISLAAATDPGSITINLDNILACKAPSAADSLSLTSLIGKITNLYWVTGTTYAVGDIRKPTSVNRNGFCYRVTAQTSASGVTEPTWPLEYGLTVVDGGVTWECYDLEDTWLAISSINGTAVTLDNAANSTTAQVRGPVTPTETIATYKREPIGVAMQAAGSTSANTVSGAGTSNYNVIGGWDTTSMATQTGETWLSGQNGAGSVFRLTAAVPTSLDNISGVCSNIGLFSPMTNFSTPIRNCHFNNNTNGISCSFTALHLKVTGVCVSHSGSSGISHGSAALMLRLDRVSANSNIGSGILGQTNGDITEGYGRFINLKNNSSYGMSSTGALSDVYLYYLTSANNSSNTHSLDFNGNVRLKKALCSETNLNLGSGSASLDCNTHVFSHDHNRVVGSHYILGGKGCAITSATDRRHTASGYSWKFTYASNTSVGLSTGNNEFLAIAKVYCLSGAPATVKAWLNRSSASIVGRITIRGGQIAGVPVDISDSLSPTINTWVETAGLTFTPTEDGFVEILFDPYTTAVPSGESIWIDDVTITR